MGMWITASQRIYYLGDISNSRWQVDAFPRAWIEHLSKFGAKHQDGTSKTDQDYVKRKNNSRPQVYLEIGTAKPKPLRIP